MQEILVFTVVAAAAIYLGKMLWDAGSGRKSGCNSCASNCASQKKSDVGSTPRAGTPLMQIDINGLNGNSKK